MEIQAGLMLFYVFTYLPTTAKLNYYLFMISSGDFKNVLKEITRVPFSIHKILHMKSSRANPFVFNCLGLAAILIALQTGCTSDLKTATNAYDAGEFTKASEEMEKAAPEQLDAFSTDPIIKVEYARDLLWAGLEKAKIDQDEGHFKKSLKLYTYVHDKADFLRSIESFYAKNPFDTKNWDAGQFMQDAGQAVVGADQTDYVLQPYEMILINAYAMLDAMMLGQDAAPYAKRAVRLQEFERDDLKRAGYAVMQPNAKSIDLAVHKKEPSVSGFSTQTVFKDDKFSKARAELSSVIKSAQEVRAADPRVTLAYTLEWAAYVMARDFGAAETAVKMVRETSGASKLADRMQAVKAKDDFILVLVGAGKAPKRASFDIKLPIPFPGGMGYFRGVYPFLEFRTKYRPNQITITSQTGTETLEIIDSIDAIMARNFQRREPELWWVPTIRGILRTATAMAGQALAGSVGGSSGGYAKLGIALAGVIVAEAEQADLRIWSTLPGAHYAALVKRPADGVLDIEIGDGSTKNKVIANVKEGSSLVYIRALTPNMHTKAYVASLIPGSTKSRTSDSVLASKAPSVRASTPAVVVGQKSSSSAIVKNYNPAKFDEPAPSGQIPTTDAQGSAADPDPIEPPPFEPPPKP